MLYILLALFTYKWYIYTIGFISIENPDWYHDCGFQASYNMASTLPTSHTFYSTLPYIGLFSSFSYPESFQLILSLPSTDCPPCLDHSPFVSRLLFIHASALSSNVLALETFPHLPMSTPLSISFHRTSYLSFVSGHIALPGFLAISAPHRHCLILLIFL